jgi:hypothetical protein
MGLTRALVEPKRVLRDRGLPTMARIGRELDTGQASVGVLTSDFETEAVAEQLKDLGGTPETHWWRRWRCRTTRLDAASCRRRPPEQNDV